VLVVLAHHADRSALWAYERLRARSRGRVDLVLMDVVDDLETTWYHQLGAAGVGTEIRLRDGRRLRAHAVTAVLNRVLEPPRRPVAAAAPEDSEYALGELTAFAASWIRALAPRVVNAPTPQGLCGRWRPELHWRVLALRAGLPIVPLSIDSTDPPANPYAPSGLPGTNLLAIGGTLLTDGVPAAVAAGVRRLSALAGTAILGLRFAGSDPHLGGWRLIDASPYPDLSSAGELGVAALEAALAR
jgi:hypothetical protein